TSDLSSSVTGPVIQQSNENAPMPADVPVPNMVPQGMTPVAPVVPVVEPLVRSTESGEANTRGPPVADEKIVSLQTPQSTEETAFPETDSAMAAAATAEPVVPTAVTPAYVPLTNTQKLSMMKYAQKVIEAISITNGLNKEMVQTQLRMVH
ncbi:MAG: hypothetical protein HQL26_11215, partial [Candidatus Omnitrophica bacterium]|nr:hypothetical protein [Candidatus Omnitrophota bacterium]